MRKLSCGEFIHSFIQQILLNASYVPGTIPGAEDAAVSGGWLEILGYVELTP